MALGIGEPQNTTSAISGSIYIRTTLELASPGGFVNFREAISRITLAVNSVWSRRFSMSTCSGTSPAV